MYALELKRQHVRAEYTRLQAVRGGVAHLVADQHMDARGTLFEDLIDLPGLGRFVKHLYPSGTGKLVGVLKPGDGELAVTYVEDAIPGPVPAPALELLVLGVLKSSVHYECSSGLAEQASAVPHAVRPGAELLADARQTGIEVLHQSGLDHLVRERQLQSPRHGGD
ncbi:hypothetical protein EYF80_032541 [Liparis tanakae]|uniref:Uncharacterized protein n=1 Tax=Liparis tanakae TaxID=230148 RepID=A0A4Z2GUC1_9TELE|nr:hypothetical protein EYF80_032541 [Liparis tanakae]